MLAGFERIARTAHKSPTLRFAVTAGFVVLSVITSLFAQDDVGVRFPEGAHQISIPAEYVEGAPFVEVRIEGSSRPLWFTIDTGSSYTVLDRTTAKQLGLKLEGKDTLHGAGGGAVEGEFAKNVAFIAGGFRAGGYNVYTTDFTGLRSETKHPIDGFFGFDFMEKLVVTFDFDNSKVVLTDPAQFHYSGNGAVVPFTFGGGRHRWIYVPGTVKVEGNPAQELQFFVDSGSGDAVDTAMIKKSTGKLRQTQTGVGLGSANTGVIGPVEWFRLGPFEIRDAPSTCCGGLEGTENMIGNAVLSRFVVTFDYGRKQLILEKGRHFADPFNN